MIKFLKIAGLLLIGVIVFGLISDALHRQDVKSLTQSSDPAPFSKEVGRPVYIGLAPDMVNVHYYLVTDQQLADPQKLKQFSWNQCHGIHSGGDCQLYYWKDKSKIPSKFKPLDDAFVYDAFYSRKVEGGKEFVTFKIRDGDHYPDF